MCEDTGNQCAPTVAGEELTSHEAQHQDISGVAYTAGFRMGTTCMTAAQVWIQPHKKKDDVDSIVCLSLSHFFGPY